MEGIIPPENNSPSLSTAVKLVILAHQTWCVYDAASF